MSEGLKETVQTVARGAQQAGVDGICAKGVTGACFTFLAGNVDIALGIIVGLVTLAYMVPKAMMSWRRWFRRNRNGED